MGVSQYFHFITNDQKGFSLLDNTVCEETFSPILQSSPVKDSIPDVKNDKHKDHRNINNVNV